MKELPSNKEIAVTAFCVVALFLSGYICNIQEHRSVVADLRKTITGLQFENYQYKRDYAILEKVIKDTDDMDTNKISKNLDEHFSK